MYLPSVYFIAIVINDTKSFVLGRSEAALKSFWSFNIISKNLRMGPNLFLNVYTALEAAWSYVKYLNKRTYGPSTSTLPTSTSSSFEKWLPKLQMNNWSLAKSSSSACLFFLDSIVSKPPPWEFVDPSVDPKSSICFLGSSILGWCRAVGKTPQISRK